MAEPGYPDPGAGSSGSSRNVLAYFVARRNIERVRELPPDTDLDELLRAFAHPARRAILRQTWGQEQTAGALAEHLGLAPATVSEHLKVLRKTGLVVQRRHGTFRWYAAAPAVLARLGEAVTRFPDDQEDRP